MKYLNKIALLAFGTLFTVNVLGAADEKPEIEEKFKTLSEVSSAWGKTKKDTIERSEVLLDLGKILEKDGYKYVPYRIALQLMRLHPGTDLANNAAELFEKIYFGNGVDDPENSGEVLWDMDWSEVPGERKEMFRYFSYIRNNKIGFDDWAKKELSQIMPGSAWDALLKYQSGLRDLSAGNIDSAFEKWTAVANSAGTPFLLKNRTLRSLARVHYERQEYQKGLDILNTLTVPLREQGFWLLEKAWNMFYLKDYRKALGLLYVIESPLYDSSRTPEVYFLKMSIYRELCQYDAIQKVLEEFKYRFSSAVEAIKNRTDLRNHPGLIKLASMEFQLGTLADYYRQLNKERELLIKNRQQIPQSADFLRDIEFKKAEVYSRLQRLMGRKVRSVANDLVMWQEQVSLLDYQSKIESLRFFNPMTEEEQEAKKIPLTEFDQIYWKFKGEFWLDELNNFEVLIDNACPASGGPK